MILSNRMQRKIPKLSDKKLLQMVREDINWYNKDTLRIAFAEVARRKKLSGKDGGAARHMSRWSSVAATKDPSIRKRGRTLYFVVLGIMLAIVLVKLRLSIKGGLTLSAVGLLSFLIFFYFSYELLKSKLESYGRNRGQRRSAHLKRNVMEG